MWLLHFAGEQTAESREQRADSREERAESGEQRIERREQRAESREQRAEKRTSMVRISSISSFLLKGASTLPAQTYTHTSI
jgi:sRNA-binding protein